MIALDDTAYDIGDIEEAAASRSAGQTGQQEYHQLLVRAYRQRFDFLVDRLHDLIDLREQQQPSGLTYARRPVHAVGNAELRGQPVGNIRLQNAPVLQQPSDFRVGQQHEFIDRVEPDSFVPLRAVLLVRLERQKFHVVRLLALLLGQRVLRQPKAAVDLIFQAKQSIDPRAAQADDEDRIVDRIDTDFVADDASA
ncbi:hypothetical protein D3C77_322240 [compost metagenome]